MKYAAAEPDDAVPARFDETSHPCPALHEFKNRIRETLDADGRERLKRIGVLTSFHPKITERRAWMCLDWMIRDQAATFFEAAGKPEQARELRELPEITDAESVERALPLLHEAERVLSGTVAKWGPGMDEMGKLQWISMLINGVGLFRDGFALTSARWAGAAAGWSPWRYQRQESALGLLDRMCNLGSPA